MRHAEPWRERSWHDHYSWWTELVTEADRGGVAEVWLSEHHFFADRYLPQPLVYSATLAARTRSIRLGTAVFLLPPQAGRSR